jgi:hypothetical protein
MLATQAAECGSSASADTLRRQALSAGNSGQPAIVALAPPAAIGPADVDAGGELSRWATAGGTAGTVKFGPAPVVGAVELALAADRLVDAGRSTPDRGAEEPQATSSTADTAAALSVPARRPRTTA